MDIEFFLLERTKFIVFFYKTASAPFSKIMNDIENQIPLIYLLTVKILNHHSWLNG